MLTCHISDTRTFFKQGIVSESMQQVIPNDLVRDALDAVCSSAVFVRSPQHQRLLRYLVEELMADRPANLREIHLGVQVFGRSAAMFDPANDTIVRVEARRLRARLKRRELCSNCRSAAISPPSDGGNPNRCIATTMSLGQYWLCCRSMRLAVVTILRRGAMHSPKRSRTR